MSVPCKSHENVGEGQQQYGSHNGHAAMNSSLARV